MATQPKVVNAGIDLMVRKGAGGKKLESALEDLEEDVEQLESGELSLEDSLAVFEKGVGLVKFCDQKLNEVDEKKIEVRVKDKEGKLQLKAFEELPGQDNEDD